MRRSLAVNPTERADEVTEEPEPPDSLLEALAATPGGEVLARGTVLDEQYRILRVLGEGGMGVVYLARDLRLARDVAVKLGNEQSSSSFGRLAREALALAQLSHPNVVVIHQVGEIDGRAYVAMEYVPGGTAREWCRDRRGWREIVALYVAAGQGLAAAHAAGLVHRDFKPDNVLVGGDGRPRVADFGLAHAGEVASPASAAGATQAGARAGTPAYMAPEQALGGAVDARADQYAFCASLWEALLGVRPFADAAPREALAPALREEPRRPGHARVPRHVEAALRRGLRGEADARWPSLGPLLAELRRDPARRRARVALAAGGVFAGALALGMAATSRRADAAAACAGATAELTSVWNAARAIQLRATEVRRGAADEVIAAVDRWGSEWRAGYRAVCEAGLGAWSAQLHDRGVACLAQRKRQLATTVDVLATAAGASPDRAVEALPSPAACSDPAYLTASVPPPGDPARAALVRVAQAELTRVRALTLVGDVPRARSVLAAVATMVELAGYPPLAAQLDLERGRTTLMYGDDRASLELLQRAYFAARMARDCELAAAAASEATVALIDLSRDRDASDWARLAVVEAEVAAAPQAELAALRAVAAASLIGSDLSRAVGDASRYVDQARRYANAGLGDALVLRAQALDRVGDAARALADLDEADRLQLARHGASAPARSTIATTRSMILNRARRFDEAIASARDGLAIAAQTEQSDGALIGGALSALGAALKDAGRLDEALAVMDRSLAESRAHDGEHSYNFASDLNNRADLLDVMRRLDDALAQWQRAGEVFREVVGPEAIEVAMVEHNVAKALIGAGRPAEASAPAGRALAIVEHHPESSLYGTALVAVGVAEVGRRSWRAAKDALTRGLARVDASDRVWRGRAQLGLAQVALAERDPVTARALAAQARDLLSTAGLPNAAAVAGRIAAGRVRPEDLER